MISPSGTTQSYTLSRSTFTLPAGIGGTVGEPSDLTTSTSSPTPYGERRPPRVAATTTGAVPYSRDAIAYEDPTNNQGGAGHPGRSTRNPTSRVTNLVVPTTAPTHSGDVDPGELDGDQRRQPRHADQGHFGTTGSTCLAISVARRPVASELGQVDHASRSWQTGRLITTSTLNVQPPRRHPGRLSTSSSSPIRERAVGVAYDVFHVGARIARAMSINS